MHSRIGVLLVGLALLAAACSGDDTDATVPTPTSTTVAEAPVADTSAPEEPSADAPEVEAPAPETPEVESDQDPGQLDPRERGVLRNYLGYEFPPAPGTPTGPIDQTTVDNLEIIWAGLELGGFSGTTVASTRTVWKTQDWRG